MKTIDKIVWSQDAFFKIEPRRSGETSINLSNELFEFLGGIDDGYITFTIYKEDFVKALGALTALLPLYTSSSKTSTKADYDNSLFENYYRIIQQKFGNEDSASYRVHMFRRSDGRIYLNELKESETDFSIRLFFIQAHTILTFVLKDDNEYDIRIRTSIEELDKNYQAIDVFNPDVVLASNWNQRIYFGTPGSGKSHKIKNLEEVKEADKYDRVIRTTFHPDTDYATFVGCYKPVTYVDKEEKKISYEFVPQAFTNAYVNAWSDRTKQYYLIIEEINRGNCAQIFGDLFQLLDRNEDGFSDYPINADNDLRDYLEENLPYGCEGIKNGKLCLPPNLTFYASMNTSDQSLFPMDSAFKRRWAWEYVPIDYANSTSGLFTVNIGDKYYLWHDFLIVINERIKKVTSSEDKQMGNFFIKQSVGEKEFKDKVMFYLWSEVGKDNYQTNDAIFHCYKPGTTDKQEFSFNELYAVGSTKKLQDFFAILGVKELNDEEMLSIENEDSDELGSQKNFDRYSINGSGEYNKRTVAYESVQIYAYNNPNVTAQQMVDTWLALNFKAPNLIETSSSHAQRAETTKDRLFNQRSRELKLQNGESIYVSINFTLERIQDFIEKVNAQDWGIHINKL